MMQSFHDEKGNGKAGEESKVILRLQGFEGEMGDAEKLPAILPQTEFALVAF
jgi:hypothetical protein